MLEKARCLVLLPSRWSVSDTRSRIRRPRACAPSARAAIFERIKRALLPDVGGKHRPASRWRKPAKKTICHAFACLLCNVVLRVGLLFITPMMIRTRLLPQSIYVIYQNSPRTVSETSDGFRRRMKSTSQRPGQVHRQPGDPDRLSTAEEDAMQALPPSPRLYITSPQPTEHRWRYAGFRGAQQAYTVPGFRRRYALGQTRAAAVGVACHTASADLF